MDIQSILSEHALWLSGKGGARADLCGADLYGADLRRADLRRADLYGADLSEADLSRANLRGADLYGADLRGADLRGADLNGADLREADLRRANLNGEILQITPLQLSGLLWPVLITAEFMTIGCQRHRITEWAAFSNERIAAMHPQATEFWTKWKHPLLAMCANHAAASNAIKDTNQ